MCDRFVRRVNQGLLDRLWPPMASTIASNRRGLVNEVAFQVFASEVRAQAAGVAAQDLNSIVQTVAQRLAKFDQSHSDLGVELEEDERNDVAQQLHRLRLLFPTTVDVVTIVEPRFSGCGFLDSCNGDVLRGQTLYEIKAGERPLRSIDLRQVVTYAALNHVGRTYHISEVSIVNLRSGLALTLDLETLAQQTSGLHPGELFDLIAYSLSSGDMSR
jgi:hypothetical protein